MIIEAAHIEEYDLPTKWAGSYDTVVDRNGEVWMGGMQTDYIYRFNPKTRRVLQYMLPSLNANVRRINADKSGKSVTIWVGENLQAKIAKLEFLD